MFRKYLYNKFTFWKEIFSMAVVYTEMKDRVAIITGGGGGIGRQVGLKLGESGAKIFVVDAFREPIDKALAELKANGINAAGYVVDVRNEEAVQGMVDTCMATFGSADYLICCAGIYTHSPLDEMPLETWQQTIDINLTGTFLCLQKTVREMLKAGFGRIVLFGSQSGIRGSAKHVHYGASKGGIITMTRAFMREVADKNIRVNCVSPGVIATPMTAETSTSTEQIEQVKKGIPMGRVGEPREVANVVAFLLSDESSFMTGQTINITGGAIVNT
jgi:NAD(P)-dependent dehydrogenase (short-subunit alcohol dehydrogenase family)